MGATQEGAKAVSGIIDSLKSQPLSLALVIMNIMLLVFLYYEFSTISAARARELELLYQNRKEVGELLAGCIRPELLPRDR